MLSSNVAMLKTIVFLLDFLYCVSVSDVSEKCSMEFPSTRKLFRISLSPTPPDNLQQFQIYPSHLAFQILLRFTNSVEGETRAVAEVPVSPFRFGWGVKESFFASASCSTHRGKMFSSGERSWRRQAAREEIFHLENDVDETHDGREITATQLACSSRPSSVECSVSLQSNAVVGDCREFAATISQWNFYDYEIKILSEIRKSFSIFFSAKHFLVRFHVVLCVELLSFLLDDITAREPSRNQ